MWAIGRLASYSELERSLDSQQARGLIAAVDGLTRWAKAARGCIHGAEDAPQILMPGKLGQSLVRLEGIASECCMPGWSRQPEGVRRGCLLMTAR